jgi:hypothetical protein
VRDGDGPDEHSVLHENRVEKAFRDARLTQIFEGTNQINRLGVIEDAQERLLEAVEAARPECKARGAR